jgi:hypothetical protein
MSLITLSGPHQPTRSWPTLRLFRWPIIGLTLTLLSMWGVKAAGIGPCGGFGIFFVVPFLLSARLTAVSFCISCWRLISRRRTA